MVAEADTYPELVASDSGAYWMTPAKVRADELEHKIDEYTDSPELIIDVGTGDASFYMELSERFESGVVGLEKYRGVLEDLHRFEVIQADGTEAIKTGSVDCLCYINSLQAMEDPAGELKSAYRVLKEGGMALVTGPTEKSIKLFPERSIDWQTEPPRIVTEMKDLETYSQYFFPGDWLEKTAQDTGFKLLERSEIAIDIRGLPHLYDHVRPGYRPETDGALLENLRERPEATMEKLLENSEAPEVGLWVLRK